MTFKKCPVCSISSFRKKAVRPNMNPGKRENATGAYFFSDVKAPLSKVIKYAYNPKIPAYVTLPSVIRLGGWQVKPTGTVASFMGKGRGCEGPASDAGRGV